MLDNWWIWLAIGCVMSAAAYTVLRLREPLKRSSWFWRLGGAAASLMFVFAALYCFGWAAFWIFIQLAQTTTAPVTN